jgi:hypothetical protein
VAEKGHYERLACKEALIAGSLRNALVYLNEFNGCGQAGNLPGKMSKKTFTEKREREERREARTEHEKRFILLQNGEDLNYYELLEINTDATEADIKRVSRKMART